MYIWILLKIFRDSEWNLIEFNLWWIDLFTMFINVIYIYFFLFIGYIFYPLLYLKFFYNDLMHSLFA